MTVIFVTGTGPAQAGFHPQCTEVEPLLRAPATVEINTRIPLAEVVNRLAALSGR
jgi:hypothetical protein